MAGGKTMRRLFGGADAGRSPAKSAGGAVAHFDKHHGAVGGLANQVNCRRRARGFDNCAATNAALRLQIRPGVVFGLAATLGTGRGRPLFQGIALKHLFRYFRRGLDGCPGRCRAANLSHRGLVRHCHPDWQPGRHQPAGVACATAGRCHRLRGHAPHARAAAQLWLRAPQRPAAGRTPTQRGPGGARHHRALQQASALPM